MKLFNYLLNTILGFLIFNCIYIHAFENKNLIQFESKNSITETSKLNSGIFLTEKAFKYKNTKKAKTENNFTSKKSSSNLKSSAQIKTNVSLKKISPNIEISSPILYEGWIKYFKYSQGSINSPIPKGFNINPEFLEEKKDSSNEDPKKIHNDSFSNFIREETDFYLHLFEKMIIINSSKLVKKYL
jgi:hypothetical protein